VSTVVVISVPRRIAVGAEVEADERFGGGDGNLPTCYSIPIEEVLVAAVAAGVWASINFEVVVLLVCAVDHIFRYLLISS